VPGKQRRHKVGRYPILSLNDARERATELLAQAERGIDIALTP